MALRLRLRKPVFPIALLLTPNSGGLTIGRHVDSVFAREVATLNYGVIGLRDLREEDFAATSDPLAQALRSLMKTRRPPKSVVEESIRRVYDMDRHDGRMHMLNVLILEYSGLTNKERLEVREKIKREEPEMYEWMTREEERRYKAGKREGRQEGREEGQRQHLLKLIERRFGPLAQPNREAVLSLSDARLDTVSERLLTAQEIGDLELPIN